MYKIGEYIRLREGSGVFSCTAATDPQEDTTGPSLQSDCAAILQRSQHQGSVVLETTQNVSSTTVLAKDP